MIGAILNMVGELTRLAILLMEFLERRQLVETGRAQQQLENIKGQIDATKTALAAREAVRADLANRPGQLPVDDPFLRD
jgi:hypothetical protein